MRSHCLLRLDDNRSAASCQQAWCNLIIETLYSQAWCKLFQQLTASLQISSCNKSDFHRLAATWWNWQACCNLLTNLHQAGKIHNLQQVCGVSGCVDNKIVASPFPFLCLWSVRHKHVVARSTWSDRIRSIFLTGRQDMFEYSSLTANFPFFVFGG